MQKIKLRFAAFWLAVFGILCVFANMGGASVSSAVVVSTPELPPVYPCGFPIGIYLRTDGVMVIGTARIPDERGTMREPAAGLIAGGDYITSINGESVYSKEEFQEKINRFGGEPVTLQIDRNGSRQEVTVTPVRGSDGGYRIGVWVKDDIQGIGTMTYLTEDGKFGALGHPISDTDTGKMVHARTGGLYQAQIRKIVKGSNGIPGSFSGVICYDRSTCLGEIETNSECGIFGTIDADRLPSLRLSGPCEVARRSEAACREAVIRCTLGNEVRDYEIMILNLNAGSRSDRGFLFQVTDEKLLSQTGGIIQGMSGSPILQDGKLLGAVTHVFVKDSTRGYGIYIEDMMAP